MSVEVAKAGVAGRSYVVGIDVGGTFTDCVLLDDAGHAVADKSPTTPDNTARGMIDALSNTAQALGADVGTVLRQVRSLTLGTTSLTNKLITRGGAKVGLLTTRGHEDAILVGRVLSKTDGLSEAEMTDLLTWSKPKAIVPRPLIRGINERIDYKGAVVAPLNERDVEEALAQFEREGVTSVAVCFLWAFRNPVHERRVREIVRKRMPKAYVALSSEVAPVLGEYERANAVVLSAHLGPIAKVEIDGMRVILNERGLTEPYFVMASNGGSLLDQEVPDRPLDILASGPAGGVVATARLGATTGYRNVIATDMGGTSFEVAIVTDATARLSSSAVYNRFRVIRPHVEVVSIGAGGGSIAWVDSATGGLRVGPQSGGAVPGPVCYDQGGTEPTVTDADVVLGRIDPALFFSGRKKLDAEKARAAIRSRVAEPLGLDEVRAAEGVLKIVDARMGDLIRKLTVERGLDPNDFVLFAYGGAGATHVGAYAREAGVRTAVVPVHSAAFSALGCASADVVRSYTRSDPMRSPFDAARIRENFESLARSAEEDQRRTSLGVERMELSRWIDMRFRHQVHQVRVPVAEAALDDAGIRDLTRRFVALYEQSFGGGTAATEAGIEILTFYLEARTRHVKLELREEERAGADPSAARIGSRQVCFEGAFVSTPVYAYGKLRCGNSVPGPAIIEAGNTTVVVHPGQVGTLDALRNIVLAL